MKKTLLLITLVMFLLTGCKKSNSASDVVKDYLNSYINLSNDVKKEIDENINSNDEFDNDNKKMYEKLFLRQYKDLKYTILTEEYDNNTSLVTVNINVYDYRKAEEEAVDYLSKNLIEFYDEDNNFDNNKYINYKLDLMYNSKERIDYKIIISLKYKDKNWILEQPTDDDLEKIHGIYDNTESP